jgi:hypothetical protein
MLILLPTTSEKQCFSKTDKQKNETYMASILRKIKRGRGITMNNSNAG